MENELRRVAVRFYFADREAEQAEERLGMARELLSRDGQEVSESSTKLKDGVEMVELTAQVSSGLADQHRGFDSKLNKSYPDGCGAGEVW